MEAPKIPSMFSMRLKKNNQFYFEPRYYSKRKEKMEQRYKSISNELGIEESKKSSKDDFKAEMRDNWGNSYSRNATGSQLNKKVIFYVVALVVLAYFLIYY